MSRESRIVDQMDLLGIKDVSTPRQAKNGTVVWQLPIKNNWPGNQANASFIKVASFSTGYVRNQNSGYSNYQLNKRCESEPQYYPDHEWKTLGNGDYTQVKTGKYRKYTTRSCVLIPNEIDRLEYLIAYCLKNYYIKNANQVINGDYVSKWEHEYMLENANSPTVTRNLKKISESNDRIYELESQLEKVKTECNHAYDCGLSDAKTKASELEDRIYELESQVNCGDKRLAEEVKRYDNAINGIDCGHYDRIKELESDVHNLENKLANYYTRIKELESDVHNLENKLATIERIASDRNKWEKE